MPYIQPNTRVYILKGVPLDNTYEHTVYYANATSQLNAFLAYKKYELEKLSYQRTGAGLMRVQLTYEQMYDCNYMVFQNTAYGNKWWYAFITGVAYVNNTTCEISYEIDVMQTWCYDYTFLPTFVDREHVDPSSESFNNYKNYIQPEGLETGSEPKVIKISKAGGEIRGIMLQATTGPQGQNVALSNNNLINCDLYGLFTIVFNTGLYNPGNGFENSSQAQAVIDTVNDFINNGFGENIVSFQACPTGNYSWNDTSYSVSSSISASSHIIDSYSIKNPKLLCYPYRYFVISNMEGGTLTIKPEFLTGNTVDTRVFSTAEPSPMSTLYVKNYNYNISQTDIYSEMRVSSFNSLTITDYPTFAVANDSYKAWWAQNKNSYLATQGNIARSYNTEMANIGNSYAQQMASNTNSYKNALNSANISATVSENSNRNTRDVARNNATYGIVANAAGALGNILSVGDPAKTIDYAVSAGQNIVNEYNAGLTYQTNQQNINNIQMLANATATNNYNTGKYIAELSKQATALSALTNNQNATASLVAKKQDMLNAPDHSIGSISGSAIRQFSNTYGFVVFEVCARQEFLRMADNYFEKYGYKIAMLKTPNRMNSRPYWHYLQTTGCNIKGNFNVTDISSIKTIYNNGITTWNALENVGNYNLNNHTTTSTLSEENENE